jgi:glycosyltransferase involved in cell wall biosynthesis
VSSLAQKTARSSVLIVANWDWVIYNFRLSLAQSAETAGYDVAFVCPDGKYVDELRKAGFRWIEWPLDRRSLNPITELRSILSLAHIYAREKPGIIHHDTIKPNIYGSIATWLNQRSGITDHPPRLINSFMGIGFLFSDHFLARILLPIVLPFMKLGMRRDHVYTTFSNRGDYATFVNRGLVNPSQAQVIVSEFVKTDRFVPSAKREDTLGEDSTVRVLLAARLLWDKGIQEYVDAARILHNRGVSVKFLLAGEPDLETPGYVPVDQLRRWNEKGIIQWLGHCSDMPHLLGSVDIASLPTHYNEGLPRFLVEAASSGLPIVASDLEACRRVVEDGVNGYVVPKQDARSLADAIQHLALNPEERREMGKDSRRKAEAEFAERKVVEEWLDLYNQRADR